MKTIDAVKFEAFLVQEHEWRRRSFNAAYGNKSCSGKDLTRAIALESEINVLSSIIEALQQSCKEI